MGEGGRGGGRVALFLRNVASSEFGVLITYVDFNLFEGFLNKAKQKCDRVLPSSSVSGI